ncbi:MAG: hypothetical protein EA398_08335 [Deltaproteobacteria bacterium]|nr:MAG: hypothetical protein EA398_08335 [Deltaproteobacteria bacterium]
MSDSIRGAATSAHSSRNPGTADPPEPASRRSGPNFQQVLRGSLQVASAVVPGAGLAGSVAGNEQAAMMARVETMQAEGRIFQLELLALQEQIQADHRTYSTMSNVIRARHDTARAAIQNIRA